MKVTYEFDLSKEDTQETLDCVHHAEDMYGFIIDFKNWLRGKHKYEEPTNVTWTDVYDAFCRELDSSGVGDLF